MKQIPLTQNKFAIVDDKDFENLNQFKWFFNGKGYAGRSKWIKGGNSSIQILMHRIILNAPKNQEIDHINGDGLDNRRENLRLCSHAENSKNRKFYKNNTSGVRGVVWDKQMKSWAVQFWFDGKPFPRKLFKNIKNATIYRQSLETVYYKEFRRLNV